MLSVLVVLMSSHHSDTALVHVGLLRQLQRGIILDTIRDAVASLEQK